MRRILLVFFIILSIALISTFTLAEDNVHDPGIELIELPLKADSPTMDNPGENISLPPGKYDTKDPDIDTKIVVDNTPTCDQVFAAIDKKEKAGVALSQYDQAMRARCIDQPKSEDDDEIEESRDELFSLQYPKTDHQEVGGITKIWLERHTTCCPQVQVVCPGCPKGYPGSGPSNGQSVNSSSQPNQGSNGSYASSPSTGSPRNEVQPR